MALLARSVILHARDADPAFTTGRIAQPVAWRALTRLYVALVARVAQTNPDVLDAAASTTALPLSAFALANGITLGSDVLQPLDVQAFNTVGEPQGVEVVPYTARAGTVRHPAATFLGNTVHLLGLPDWWTPWASVTVRYVPQPSQTLTDATTLALPDDALDVLAAKLAAWMATRVAGSAKPTVINAGQLLTDANGIEAEFLLRIGGRQRGQTLRIREVF